MVISRVSLIISLMEYSLCIDKIDSPLIHSNIWKALEGPFVLRVTLLQLPGYRICLFTGSLAPLLGESFMMWINATPATFI